MNKKFGFGLGVSLVLALLACGGGEAPVEEAAEIGMEQNSVSFRKNSQFCHTP